MLILRPLAEAVSDSELLSVGYTEPLRGRPCFAREIPAVARTPEYSTLDVLGVNRFKPEL